MKTCFNFVVRLVPGSRAVFQRLCRRTRGVGDFDGDGALEVAAVGVVLVPFGTVAVLRHAGLPGEEMPPATILEDLRIDEAQTLQR